MKTKSGTKFWGLIAIVAGGGLNVLAFELGKLLPWPDEQVMSAAGVVAIVAGLILQLHDDKA